MKDYLKIKYLPLFFFSCYFTKVLFIGCKWEDIAFLAVLGAVAGFYEFKSIGKDLETLHKRFEATDAHLTALYKENESLKNAMSTFKMSSSSLFKAK